MKKFERWTSKELPKGFQPVPFGEGEDSILIGVKSRDPPSIISSATSSNASVATTASTAALLPFRVKKYLGKQEKIVPASQREINILLAEDMTDPKKKRMEAEMCDPTSDLRQMKANRRAAIFKQVLAAFAISLGSLVVGFSSAFTAPALVSMDHPDSRLHVSVSDASWIGSLMPLSALIGGLLGGPLIEGIGRRNTIISTSLPFMLAFLLIHFAENVAMIKAGRILTGLSVGIASLALPVYLGETIEARVRGTLGLLPTSFGNLGILLAFIAGTYLDWTNLALVGAFLPVPFLILAFLIPESPLWYISRGKDKKAKESLQWLRGKDTDVNEELRSFLKSHKDLDSGDFVSTLKDLFSKRNFRPFFICLGLMFFQQFSGINAVIFYTVTIFRDAGSTIDSNLSSIIVGIVNLASTLLATVLIDKLGRKILLYISETLMGISLGVLAVYFYLQKTGYDLSTYGWIPLPAFVVFIFAFAIGAGPVPWLMMGEILPSKIRGAAASIVTAFNWAGTFAVTKTFVDIKATWGTHAAFAGFAVICVIGLLFTVFYVPETQGKTLDEIEEQLTGKKVSIGSVRSPARSASLAALKPLPSMV